MRKGCEASAGVSSRSLLPPADHAGRVLRMIAQGARRVQAGRPALGFPNRRNSTMIGIEEGPQPKRRSSDDARALHRQQPDQRLQGRKVHRDSRWRRSARVQTRTPGEGAAHGSRPRLRSVGEDGQPDQSAGRRRARGAFYVNEYGDVLVPDGVGGSYFAGNYDKRLEFAFNGGVLTSRAAPGLEPGDVWEGPHPGIRHTLCAGGADVKYESKNGARTTEVRLSDQVGAGAARATAARIAAVKGSSGGRFYINEAAELFAPVAAQNYDFLYIGHLEDSSWFVAPKGFPRP